MMMIRWALLHFCLLVTVFLLWGTFVSVSCQRQNEVLELPQHHSRHFPTVSSDRLSGDDPFLYNQMKRSTVILDKLMYALQTQLKPQGTTRKVYWRCYFNAVTCFRRK